MQSHERAGNKVNERVRRQQLSILRADLANNCGSGGCNERVVMHFKLLLCARKGINSVFLGSG